MKNYVSQKNQLSQRPCLAAAERHEAARRQGATLIEILMAILVMGLGVVSIATLFPASVLRSINATKLTNATLLRHNAESIIDIDPDNWIHDPEKIGTVKIGTVEKGTINGGNYFVDPLGYYLVDNIDVVNVVDEKVKRVGGTGPRRFPGIAMDSSHANRLVRLPDSWPELLSAGVDTFDATSVTLVDVDLSEIESGSRIVLIDETGHRGAVRDISNTIPITGSTVQFTNALPTGFVPFDARILTRDPKVHFTWLLTVRNSGGAGLPTNGTATRSAEVDVVVFFNRVPSLQDEAIWDAGGGGTKYTVKLPPIGHEKRPKIRKGGFLFNVDNGRWYRIEQVENDGNRAVRLTLSANAASAEKPIRRVIFMARVVEVYPLGTKN